MPFIPSDAHPKEQTAELMRQIAFIEKSFKSRQDDQLLPQATVERVINAPLPSEKTGSVFDNIFQS